MNMDIENRINNNKDDHQNDAKVYGLSIRDFVFTANIRIE